MARGKSTGRNNKPRIGSIDGIQVRHDERIATMPKDPKGGRGYRKPGSRNRRRVGRG